VDAAEDDHVRLGPFRLLCQRERVTDEVRNILDVRLLIVVRQDHGVEIAFEMGDLRKQVNRT